MAAFVKGIARQLQAQIEHVNALNAQVCARAVAMAEYPRMQTAMNETRDKLSAVAAQLDAIGTGGVGSGNNNGGGDSDFLVQKNTCAWITTTGTGRSLSTLWRRQGLTPTV